MARLASESKAGYYATPRDEMELVLRALQLPETTGENGERMFHVYDPCCGEGDALAMITDAMRRQGALVKSYGSEIEQSRYQAAEKVLDEVLHEGYQYVRTEPRYSLLWLNPPYQDGFSERTELTFLRALTSSKQGVLQKGGILLFCVPQYVLKPCAGVLSARFTNMAVYRFTDQNYDIFKQVILIGTYGKAPAAEQKKAYKMLVTIGEGEKDLLSTLDEMEPFLVPPCESLEPVRFRAGAMDVEEMKRDMTTSPLLEEIVNRLAPRKDKSIMQRPMLPLKASHMGVAIAAGVVGGNMGSHVIVGITKQRTDVSDIINEDTGIKEGERVSHTFSSIIRAYTPQGVVDLEK